MSVDSLTDEEEIGLEYATARSVCTAWVGKRHAGASPNLGIAEKAL